MPNRLSQTRLRLSNRPAQRAHALNWRLAGFITAQENCDINGKGAHLNALASRRGLLINPGLGLRHSINRDPNALSAVHPTNTICSDQRLDFSGTNSQCFGDLSATGSGWDALAQQPSPKSSAIDTAQRSARDVCASAFPCCQKPCERLRCHCGLPRVHSYVDNEGQSVHGTVDARGKSVNKWTQ